MLEPRVGEPVRLRRGCAVPLVILGFFLAVLVFAAARHDAERGKPDGNSADSNQGAYGRPPDPTAMLKPANRFSEADDDSPLRPAQDALNRGDVMKAVELFHSPPVTPADRATNVGKRLHRALDNAFAEISGGQTNGSAQVETLESHWRPQLAALSLAQPESLEETGKRINDLNELALALHDSQDVDLTASEKRQRDRFKADLAAKQAKLFPVLRRAYARHLGNALWQANGEASVTGKGAETLVLTSPLFAANVNIGETEAQQEAVFTKFRFKRAEYRAFDGARYQYYSLHPPADRDIGYLEGERFVPVK